MVLIAPLRWNNSWVSDLLNLGDRSTQEDYSQHKYSQATAARGVPPLSGPSLCSSLALVQTALQDKQFKSLIAERISRARRPSTLKVYEGKWHVFRDWYHIIHIVPLSVTIPQLANFSLAFRGETAGSSYYQMLPLHDIRHIPPFWYMCYQP